jgi:hypothetical protein
MTRWWSLARGEWILLAYVAGGVLGVQVGVALRLDGAAAWVVWIAAAAGLGAFVQFATRDRGTSDLPSVRTMAYLAACIPLFVLSAVVGAVIGVPPALSPAHLTWFVGGLTVARIVARVVSDYVAADGGRANTRLRSPRSLF